MHFIIEHNKGHHKRVSTDDDPSSARLNEPIYAFFFRTIIGSYVSAWHIQLKELKDNNHAFFSLQNEMGLFFTAIGSFNFHFYYFLSDNDVVIYTCMHAWNFVVGIC